MYINYFTSYNDLPKELLEHIEVSSTFSDILRKLGYSVLVALAKIVDSFYDAVTTLLSLDLYNMVKRAFPNFFAAIPTVAWALFGLAILFGGLKLAKSRSKGEASKYIDGILTTALIIVSLPVIINSLSDLRTAGVNDVDKLPVGKRVTDTSTIGQSMLSGITVDINASKNEMKYLNSSTQSPYYIDITDKLDNEGFWNKKIVTNKDVSKSVVSAYTVLTGYFCLDSSDAKRLINTPATFYVLKSELKDNFAAESENAKKKIDNCNYYTELFSEFETEIRNWAKYRPESTYAEDLEFMSWKTRSLTTEEDIEEMSFEEKIIEYVKALGNPAEYIYAYDFEFFNGLLILVTTLISLIFCGLKSAKLMYELIFNQVIAPIVVASDITNEGRRKYILQHILSTYLVFIVILFILKLYLVVVLYVVEANFSVAVELFLILGGMAFVIDGPDSVIKLIGIDAGVKSGGHTLMSVASAGRTASSAASGVASTATRAGEAALSVGARGLSSAGNVASSIGKGFGAISSGISKGAELGAKVSGGNAVGKVTGGVIGGMVGSVGGAATIGGTAIAETAKTAKTAATAVGHTITPKVSADGKAIKDASSTVASVKSLFNKSESAAPQSESSNSTDTEAAAPHGQSNNATVSEPTTQSQSNNTSTAEAEPPVRS